MNCIRTVVVYKEPVINPFLVWARAGVKSAFCVTVSRITNDPEGQNVGITSTAFVGIESGVYLVILIVPVQHFEKFQFKLTSRSCNCYLCSERILYSTGNFENILVVYFRCINYGHLLVVFLHYDEILLCARDKLCVGIHLVFDVCELYYSF